jgi:salicylate hydroxylase
VYRDPLPTWVSKEGHTVLAGDAAHPHLPTSQQGASQAIEDGVTIAVCLDLASKNGISIPLAMKAYELLRYKRTVATMKLGEEVRNVYPS